MKLLADVNISRRVVERLRAIGYEISRVPEIMDARSTDEQIVAEARRVGAHIVSQDQDFTAILAMSGATSPSLINVRVSHTEIDRLATTISEALRAAERDLAEGAIVTIDDGGIRVHPLPVS